jgi:hypothetical protein
MITIDFSFDTDYGVFSDSIVFLDNQPMPTDEEMEILKNQRLDNFIKTVTSHIFSEVTDGQ